MGLYGNPMVFHGAQGHTHGVPWKIYGVRWKAFGGPWKIQGTPWSIFVRDLQVLKFASAMVTFEHFRLPTSIHPEVAD